MTFRAIAVIALIITSVSAAGPSDTQCSPGTYSSTGSTPCTQCPPGTYQSQSHSTSCTEAQAGWYATAPGATSQSQCGTGYYSSAGSTECTVCPAGSHCNSATNDKPQLCEPGRYQATTGAQDCTECPAGTFSNVYGATVCCSCCSGWYTDQPGQTHCFNCPNRGSFQQGWSPAGASSANECIAASGALSSCSGSGSSCPDTGGAVPFGVPSIKRRANTRWQSSLRSHHKCPSGYRSCAHSFVQAYECVDIYSGLETCGGCVYMDSPNGEVGLDGGRDCSAIPNVDSVRCHKGKCRIDSCMPGYIVSTDGRRCRPKF
ncbi:hypothetical protein BDY19DRAFT_985422 [Irpex rosettiformis]|uniref:Uncharacterized protein n=1 Tax=Irpex rosettiformis TaxID=378272 RepID=A0ACB8U2G7_9APHY|nr:hypothetical protein BDY19DRAFT_985422 [Irpex rosettiformis]